MFAEATRGAANRNKIHFGSFFFREGKTKTTTDLHEGPVRHFYTVNFSVILVKSQRKKRKSRSQVIVIPLTSNRLSPTSATSSLCPLRWRTMAAFSEAYMQVKSNIATSGWP